MFWFSVKWRGGAPRKRVYSHFRRPVWTTSPNVNGGWWPRRDAEAATGFKKKIQVGRSLDSHPIHSCRGVKRNWLGKESMKETRRCEPSAPSPASANIMAICSRGKPCRAPSTKRSINATLTHVNPHYGRASALQDGTTPPQTGSSRESRNRFRASSSAHE
jgi:hypothetical protein